MPPLDVQYIKSIADPEVSFRLIKPRMFMRRWKIQRYQSAENAYNTRKYIKYIMYSRCLYLLKLYCKIVL